MVCDEYAPLLQYIRQMWNINFTNHHQVADENGIATLPCPAEVARPEVHFNAWGGNVAKTKEQWDAWEKGLDEVMKKFIGGKDADSTGPKSIPD
jgi:hypothetical protein